MKTNYLPLYGKVTEFGQYPNTDTIGISETIHPTICFNK